jgi:hypothetical protein
LRAVSWCALLFLFPAVVGCGPGQGKVSGKVLLGSEPLPGGTVTFRPADPAQNQISAAIDESGNYEAVLPAGETQVSVDNRALMPRDTGPHGIPANLPAGARAKIEAAIKENRPAASGSTPTETLAQRNRPPGKYKPIPAKYYDISTSGLKFTVERGNQTHNIELGGK